MSYVDPDGRIAIPLAPAVATAALFGGAAIIQQLGLGEMLANMMDGPDDPAEEAADEANPEDCESDEERDKRCEENLERDLETCRALGKRGGKAAYKVCEQQAMIRYSNCRSGRDDGIDAPLPPWGDTY